MLNDDALWNAVTARDARWDGTFVYGVRSTRIYCRPTCPSRRPARARVEFFADGRAAESAGFRACRRCAPASVAPPAPGLARVRRACGIIAAAPERPFSLQALARATGGSPFHLLRSFKRLLGVTPRQYADACRHGCLRSHLRSADASTVTDAIYAAGYGSGSRVYATSGRALGMTPAAYAAGANGVALRVAVVDSPLGRLLVAATPRGICSVAIGARDDVLLEGLRREFPRARVLDADEELRSWCGAIVGSLHANAPDPRLPFDVRATAFQRRVWDELQRIPRGQTRTYAEVARAVGAPSAARAVARACATNPLAIVVPCHRVVRRDGTEGGYRWGTARKHRMLQLEARRRREER
jgi:AraC family transcriptional regulator of adaptative response/methylated-DNA-[protein]-cysteine methyltransferase